ncbi:transmembrane protein 214 [Teleopsis dalmanni]|uniref:transmembrane protein 214 n=1 Tax=Teleopsis dalmanni TaxID=139649 RepID=UPI0018CDF191|nr:transmembrane protein 214 [Teleopsis dalmanni]
MASNQWELVTKTKKQRNLERKLEAHNEKKRLAAVGPRLEEILPAYQYQNLLAGRSITGEKERITSLKSASTGTKRKSKSPVKKNSKEYETKSMKQQNVNQTPKPAAKSKGLEATIREITVEKFITQLEQLKTTYVASELLWLKGVASFFNSNLVFDCDPVFSGKSAQYPSNLLPLPLKQALLQFLQTVAFVNLQYFFSSTLTQMTMDLSKNMPVVGYKLILQIVGQNWPSVCSENMATTAMLRNSYQNRSNICLSILWAVGQCGYISLMEGLKVWQNLMVPVLEFKSYSRFVSEYIEKVLHVADDQSLKLNQNQFFQTFKILKTSSNGLPRECQEALMRSADAILQKFIATSMKQSNIFLTLLRDLHDEKKNLIEIKGCISCLNKGNDSFRVWKMNYKKQLLPTLILLRSISKNFDGIAAPLEKSEAFHEFLTQVQILSNELRDPNMDIIMNIIQSTQDRTSNKRKQNAEAKKKCGCCKWVLGSVLLVAIIGAALTYDTNVNGKGVFAKSATGKFLKDAGLLPHVEKAWYVTMGTLARAYKWSEERVPGIAKPAIKLLCDLTKMLRNAACNIFTTLQNVISSKLPVAAKFLEQYVPGLPQKIENISVAVKNIVVDVFGKTIMFFKEKVLVGSLSPENLSKALNHTQNVALEYYNVFHKKVDTYAKLK